MSERGTDNAERSEAQRLIQDATQIDSLNFLASPLASTLGALKFCLMQRHVLSVFISRAEALDTQSDRQHGCFVTDGTDAGKGSALRALSHPLVSSKHLSVTL